MTTAQPGVLAAILATAAATTFTLGKGATISISPDNAAWTLVKQLKTISYAGRTTSFEDITNMDSPGANQEFAPTVIAPGTASISGVFADGDAGQLLLAAAQQLGELLYVKHQFAPRPNQSAGFVRTYTAYVQEVNGPDAQYDKASTLSGTFKISGPITDTPGVAKVSGS